MLKCMAGERGVVHLDVHLEVFIEAMSFKESYYGFRIDVILVFGGFHGLGLDEESAGETFGAGVVAGHFQHHCQMVLFSLLVGVEQAHVAFAAAPEHVVAAAEGYRGIDGTLDLYGCAGHYVEVGIGGCAVHVAAVAEHVGRAPEVLYARLGHQSLEVFGDFGHTALVFVDVGRVADEVHVVEAEILDAELLHDFEAGVSLLLGDCHGVLALVPGELLRSSAELVAALGAQCVPPCHGEFQPFLHGLAQHYALSVIVTIRHRIVRFRAFELDLPDVGEIFLCCHFFV